MTQSDAGVASLTPTKITPAELDAFSAAQVQGSFQQTSQMAAMGAFNGPVDYVGVKRGDKLIAACYVVYTRSRFGLEGSVWCGPLCDYDNPQVVEAMTEALRRSAKAHHAISVSCWPAAVYRLHDLDGKPTSDPDTTMMDNMTHFGWKHGGFTVGYESVVNRWNFVKGLDGITDEKSLLKSYDKRTQWSVKRAQSMGVHVRELSDDELGVFARIERQTAERRSFEYRGEAYFHRFKEAFGSKAHFMVAEIRIDEYMADMTAKREALSAKVAALTAKNAEHPTTKTERQLGEETRNLAAAEKRLNEAAEFAKDGDVLPAAASLFVEHPREVIYLFSGSVEQYKPFYASALIQHDAMLHFCVEHGLSRYNFYGISGVFDDPNDEGRGVLEFKQGFNGYVEQMVGKFTLPVDKFRFGVSNLAHKLLHR